MSEALALKELGNAALKAGRLDEAVRHYTDAIQVDPENAVLYSNRAAVYLQQTKWSAALADAELAIEHRGNWEKGWARKGCALFGMSRFAEANQAFQQAREFAPGAYGEEIQQCERALTQPMTGGLGLPQLLDRLQILTNLLVPVLGLVYLLSVVGVVDDLQWFAWVHRLNILCALFALARLYGRPQFTKEFAARIVPDYWTSVLVSSLILHFANPFLAGLVGPCVRGAFHFSVAAPVVFPQLAGQPQLAAVRSKKEHVEGLMLSMEVTLGFVLLFGLLSPPRDFLVVLLYWNFLRMRYMLNEKIQATFAAIRQKLDGVLLPVPVLGAVYSRVRDFLSKQVDTNQLQQQSSRCSIM